jgi:hypothetical protein
VSHGITRYSIFINRSGLIPFDTLHSVTSAIVPGRRQLDRGFDSGADFADLVGHDGRAWFKATGSAADSASLVLVKHRCHSESLKDLLAKVMRIKGGEKDGCWKTYVQGNACYYREHDENQHFTCGGGTVFDRRTAQSIIQWKDVNRPQQLFLQN